MQPFYDLHASRKAANLSINADLLNKAKTMGINLSSTLEQALADRLKEKRREQWLSDNRTAIEAYNRRVDKVGVFGDGLRKF
ncbi:MAG: type II toxin-antitoxin system CcdA family antitoxin [Terriglobia bacterium]